MQHPAIFTRAQALGLLAGGIAVTVTSLAPAQAAEVVGGIRTFWLKDPASYGQPLEAEQALNSVTVYQRFTKGIIIWTPNFGAYFLPSSEGNYQYDPASGMLRNIAKTLGPADALVIGDSQVWDGSWVGQGIQQTGFLPHFHRCGGIGFLANRRNEFPSYHDGVVNNAFPLPLGNPGFIYIGGSGNDVWQSQDGVLTAARQTIRRLREIYPNSPIVLSEVLSRRITEQTKRHELSERLALLAREENIFVVPTRYWVTDKNVAHLLEDSVHLTQAGQNALAPPTLPTGYAGTWALALPTCVRASPSIRR